MDVSTLIMFVVAAVMLAGWISQAVWDRWNS